VIWPSGGTCQHSTDDDYDYQSAWTMTWVPEGEPEVTESATSHGTGSENVAAADGWSGLMA
jgi:hypothetical protein